jgi:outer membrane receptor protein involved in Fe transport
VTALSPGNVSSDLDDDERATTGLGAIIRELFEAELGSFAYLENRGKSRNLGVELELHRKLGRVTGWVAYTWSRARRSGALGTQGWTPYALDQTHVLTATTSTTLGAWQLGARMRYATGNPVAITTAAASPGEPDVILGYRRLPGFFALDLRVDRAWRRGWGTMSVFLDVQNATNHHNVEDVTYDSSDGTPSYVSGLPILPIFGVEYQPRD